MPHSKREAASPQSSTVAIRCDVLIRHAVVATLQQRCFHSSALFFSPVYAIGYAGTGNFYFELS